MTRMLIRFPLCALLLYPLVLSSRMVEEPIAYTVNGNQFEGVLVYEGENEESRPGILMVPSWMGIAEGAIEKASKVAGDDYVVMVVDMYGVDTRPENSTEAREASSEVRGDREIMRERASGALEAFRESADHAPLDPERIAAIGFCFGGGVVLELGRSGADLDAVVSFHGDLKSPTLEEDAGDTRAKVLVLHGAADPAVPQSDVQAFITAMGETDVDWQLVQFGGAVHSFTDPAANNPARSQYDARTAARAFEMMDDLFEEIWED